MIKESAYTNLSYEALNDLVSDSYRRHNEKSLIFWCRVIALKHKEEK